MKITEPEVRYVAGLANLQLTDSEIARLQKDMDEILTHMDALGELDTSAIEPMAQVTYPGSENAALRADMERKCFTQDEALANAPDAGAGCFKVPSVIERED